MSLPRRISTPLIPWLALVLPLLLLGGFIAASLHQEYRRIEATERDRLTHQARVIDENLVRQLDGIYLALESIRRELSHWDGKGGVESVRHRLKTMADAMPGVRTFLIADHQGTIIACNWQQLVGQNISEREWFQAPRRSGHRSLLNVSPPFRTLMGNYVINVGLRISGAAGEFKGVVSAALDPAYFRILLGSVLYAPDMWAWLAHEDGRLFLRMPEGRRQPDEDLGQEGSFFRQHGNSSDRSSMLIGKDNSGSTKQLVALRTVRSSQVAMDKPLVVAVGRDASALYADWWGDVWTKSALFGMLVLATAGALYFWQRRQRTFEAIAAEFEASRKAYAERLQLATEAAGMGIWEYDLGSGQITWDAAMFTMYGRDPAQFRGRYSDWRDCWLPEDRDEIEARLQAAITSCRSLDTLFRIRRATTGELRIIRGLARVHCNQDGQPVRVIGINEDITEQHEEAEQLRQAKETAVAANAAQGTFLATIAHEFRTPLSLLTSSLDILDRYGSRLTAEKREEQKGYIRSAANQMSRLMDSVMAHNQFQTATGSRPVPLDIRRSCRSIAKEVETAWGAGQKFLVMVDVHCGTLLLDEILLRRVLENLLSNAFRYTPPGGTISLQVLRQDNRLLMEIRDSGIGIAQEEQERVFDPFCRGGNVEARRGLGLGLAIVRESLTQMEGSIALNSNIGAGTTVSVSLPIVEHSSGEERAACTQS